MADSIARLLLFDHTVRSMGGQAELAMLLMQGARELGYVSKLAAHESFDDSDASVSKLDVDPVFRVEPLSRWSLGVAGRSNVQRDLEGKNIGGSKLEKCLQCFRDSLTRPSRRPRAMLETWVSDFTKTFSSWNVQQNDTLCFTAGDDFLILALAKALWQLSLSTPLRIHVLLSQPLFDSKTPEMKRQQYGDQVLTALLLMAPHHVTLHTTSDRLVSQLADVGVRVQSIPYPVRHRPLVAKDQPRDKSPAPATRNTPCESVAQKVPTPYLSTIASQTEKTTNGPNGPRRKLLFVTGPQAQRRYLRLSDLIASMNHPLLSEGRYRLSMQTPREHFKEIIPEPLRNDFQAAQQSQQEGLAIEKRNPFEVMPRKLTVDQYHGWLDSAEVALFLGDPKHQAASCNGTLLEMMARGIPVIVPANGWCSEQLQIAGGDGSVGCQYRHLDQIPELLEHLYYNYDAVQRRATQYASVIAQRHRSTNTLLQMGIPGVAAAQTRLAS